MYLDSLEIMRRCRENRYAFEAEKSMFWTLFVCSSNAKIKNVGIYFLMQMVNSLGSCYELQIALSEFLKARNEKNN